MKLNVLLITADDLNYDSVGCYGCPVEGITPNIDSLAAGGMRFERANVSIAVCQPSRQSMLTGLYPHNNGALGFDPINKDVPTLTGILREHGYYTGIIGKVEHCQPVEQFCWNFCDDVFNAENLHGRSPYIYHRDSAKFFEEAKTAGKPYFLMANSHDPHRPFAGSQDELELFFGFNTYAGRVYSPEEVEVPGFLPDLPQVRREIAEYCTSVHRCDETVGEVLRALDEAGLSDNTLVIFLSDNGMAFPFAKANCYLNSTKTPLIARWPGVVSQGKVDSDHYIAGVDFTPTILEAAGISEDINLDGRSYLTVLKGKTQSERDMVYTQFNTTSARRSYPMRCLQSKDYGYIFNAWADGETLYTNESKTGYTYIAMVAAAQSDSGIAERVRLFDYRCREEFYDFKSDPEALQNLAEKPAYADLIGAYRKRLYQHMKEYGDPLLSRFEQYNPSLAGSVHPSRA